MRYFLRMFIFFTVIFSPSYANNTCKAEILFQRDYAGSRESVLRTKRVYLNVQKLFAANNELFFDSENAGAVKVHKLFKDKRGIFTLTPSDTGDAYECKNCGSTIILPIDIFPD